MRESASYCRVCHQYVKDTREQLIGLIEIEIISAPIEGLFLTSVIKISGNGKIII